MKTGGVEITKEQIEAGISAMQGRFSANDVIAALRRAGVEDVSDFPVAMRTADKLLQRERRAGRIGTTAENNRVWEPKP